MHNERARPRLVVYAALGVPELWRCSQGTVAFFKLVNSEYQKLKASVAFPFLQPEALTKLLAERESSAKSDREQIKEFVNWVSEQSG